MYLVDTNIWLERLLDQERAAEVGRFLAEVPADELLVSDFSFHSIGVILDRLDQHENLLELVDDLFSNGAVGLVALEPQDMPRLVEVIKEFKLDFDDAYQYVAAEKHSVELVSFDTDFAGTERGSVTPGTIVTRRQKRAPNDKPDTAN